MFKLPVSVIRYFVKENSIGTLVTFKGTVSHLWLMLLGMSFQVVNLPKLDTTDITLKRLFSSVDSDVLLERSTSCERLATVLTLPRLGHAVRLVIMHQQGKVCVETFPTFVTVIVLFLMPQLVSLEVARMIKHLATLITSVSLTVVELGVVSQRSLGGELLATDLAVNLLFGSVKCLFIAWHLDLNIMEGLKVVLPSPDAR